eukprot:CAMPEP_0118956812 /NCGR_PEP_ID=MMETSP1169-20130426/61775_1 /TAXON_ID=36882 /ORGANISM="Pyramimonas obovata, Strain CCMP722" /LENGTH=95 /DNA_ID=CAMNT_0006904859 /DNA_START=1219 /DNA_END=1507 /DNA_ORIENTATION=-
MMTQWWLPLAEVSRLRGTALGLAVIAPILRRADGVATANRNLDGTRRGSPVPKALASAVATGGLHLPPPLFLRGEAERPEARSHTDYTSGGPGER